MLLDTDVPSPPTIKNEEAQTVSCNVSLTWSTPVDNGCALTMYSVYYQQIQPREAGAPWYEINITDVLRTRYVLPLRCDTQYTIEMSAWNELGQSERSRKWIMQTTSGKFHTIPTLNLGCVLRGVVLEEDYFPSALDGFQRMIQ